MEREQEEWDYCEEGFDEPADRAGLVKRLKNSGWQLVGESGQTLIFRRPRSVSRPRASRPATPIILVAIADSSRRFHLSATLAIEGYQVMEASDAASAWQALENSSPGLAILDEHLPGRSIRELVQAIKEKASLVQTRVIVLGSQVGGLDPEVAAAAGADLYLQEPLTLAALLAHIDQLSGGLP